MLFLDKIKLTNKKVYILGGLGLIGIKVVVNALSVGAEVIILDIKKKKNTNECQIRKIWLFKIKNFREEF